MCIHVLRCCVTCDALLVVRCIHAISDHLYCLVRREEQFRQLIFILGEDSPFNYKGWQLQYKNYYGTHACCVRLPRDVISLSFQ